MCKCDAKCMRLDRSHVSVRETNTEVDVDKRVLQLSIFLMNLSCSCIIHGMYLSSSIVYTVCGLLNYLSLLFAYRICM